MKRRTMYIALALVMALAAGALAGCGQKASSESQPAPDAAPATTEQPAAEPAPDAAPAATEQSKDEVIADLKSMVAKNPEFKSVTVNETTEWTYTDDETSKPETVQSTAVYKFDTDGEQLKESVSIDYEGNKLQYFTDGKKAVFAIDGLAFSGTVEQFWAEAYSGFNNFITHVIGDLDALVSCTASAEKTESNGLASYKLTLDPEKYAAADAVLAVLAEAGMPVKEASFTVSFGANGNVASMDLAISFDGFSTSESLAFSDFDSTVVDPEPENAKPIEEMAEDMQKEIEAIFKELDSFVLPEEGAPSADAAKTN